MADQGLRVSTVDTEIEVSGASSSRGWRIWVYPGIFLVILIGVWQLAAVLGWAPVYLLPAPSDVVIRIFESWELIWGHSVTTISEIVSGFLIGTAFGLALALPISYSATVRNTLYPLIVASQAVPKIAVAPLLVLWLGLGIWPKIVITALMVFFPVVVTAAEGFSSVDRNLVELLRSVHAPRRQMFVRISIPHAMPRIFAGLKIAITLAVVGAVVGEWVGADSGLGYLLVYANTFLDSTLLFSALFVLVVVGILLFLAVGVVERLAMPWMRATNR